MRKILLATTALAGVGLLAGEAFAQAPAISTTGGPLRLGVGGYFQAYGVLFSGSTGLGSGAGDKPESHKQTFDIKTVAVDTPVPSAFSS